MTLAACVFWSMIVSSIMLASARLCVVELADSLRLDPLQMYGTGRLRVAAYAVITLVCAGGLVAIIKGYIRG